MLGRSKSYHKHASLSSVVHYRLRFITSHTFFHKLFDNTFSIETYVVLDGRMLDELERFGNK